MARKSVKPKAPRPDDLDARKAAILDAVVSEYIETAQPVGSSTVAASERVAVSPATVRSEMVALEREGFLTQPHTSAGRVPTDRGYRYFVDHLQRGSLGTAKQQELANFFRSTRGELEDVLEKTSSLLSRMTSYTSVVVAPGHTRATIRSAQIVDLGPRRALVVAVLSDGAVEKRTLEFDSDVSPSEVVEASSVLNALLLGVALDQRVEVPSRDGAVALLVRAAAAALLSGEATVVGDQVFIGGASRVAESFQAVETVRDVLGILEQQLVVVSLLQDMVDSGVSVSIGQEHQHQSLAACAVVVAPVTVDGVTSGAVGLLGPTRMNYPEAIAAAEAVSQRLAERIEEGEGARG